MFLRRRALPAKLEAAGRMIGYYIHHQGRGHVERATAIAAELPDGVTALSSLRRPRDWRRGWVQLAADDAPADQPVDATGGGALHRAPIGHEGYRSRMTTIATWVERVRPAAVVVDVSVEVAALVRLLGVPTVVVALPGRRDDPAHQLGFALAAAILAPWPELGPDVCVGLAPHRAKVRHVGGISRFDGRARVPERTAGRVLVLRGAGDPAHATGADWADLPTGPDVVVRGPGNWAEDVWPDICAADVVVAHCGLGAISDLAAARARAVLLAGERPHDEQRHIGAALAAAGVATVLAEPPTDWAPVLAQAGTADPDRWALWSTGDGAVRSAKVIMDVARAVG